MLINPIIILLTIAVVVLAVMYCVIKKTSFPILTLTSFLISGVYTFFTYLINNMMYSKGDAGYYSLVGFITNTDEISYSTLETAFSHYSTAVKVVMALSAVALAADIIRIFFKKNR